MKKIIFIIPILLFFISCSSDENDSEINSDSDKIVELISNNPASISANDLTNFNTEINYENNNITSLKTIDLEYYFSIQNDLISECILNYNNQSITYKFSYAFYQPTNSQKINAIKIYSDNQLIKEFGIYFDGFREKIENINNSSEAYFIIFDEHNRIKAFSAANNKTILYSYVNNNLASIEIDYQYKIDIQFDNKNNPFNTERFKNLNDIINYINIIKGDDLLLLNNYNIFSNSNNILSIDVNDYPDNDFLNFIYEYEYNDLDYPILKRESNFDFEVKYIYE